MALSFLSGIGLPWLADWSIPHDADAGLRAEGNQHVAAGLGLDVGRQRVVVGLVQRDRHDDRHSRGPLPGSTGRFSSSFASRLSKPWPRD